MKTRILPVLLALTALLPLMGMAQSANALNFDGSNDRVEIPDANALDFTGAGTYTIECWIKPDAFSAQAGIVSKYQTENSNGYILRLNNTAAATGLDFDGMETADGILTAGHWYHIAAVNNGGTRHLYVNGTEVALTGTAITVVANTDMLTIGVDYEAAPRYFNGTIDEMRLWNVARTQADIQANMKHTIDPATAGLVAYYQLNEGTAGGDNSGIATVTDATANHNNGTAVNFALSGNTSNWVSGISFPGSVLYVDASANGAATGGDWQDAFTSLSDALAYAQLYDNVDSILVAQGTYYPTGEQSGTNRDSAFAILRGGLKLLGGYPSGGGARDPQANPAYFDGNINDVGNDGDNSFHVMVIAGLPANADSVVVDGFTIRNAYGSGGDSYVYNGVSISQGNGGGIIMHSDTLGNKLTIRNCTFTTNCSFAGGGILCHTNTSPLITHCTFDNNTGVGGDFNGSGGGLYNYNGSSPLITDCSFTNNIVNNLGGGIHNDIGCNATIVNCIFAANRGKYGGGIDNLTNTVTIINCRFTGNSNGTNGGDGGGIYSAENASLSVINCTMEGNTAANNGSAIYSDLSTTTIKNSIIWNNTLYGSPTVIYSIVQGGYTGTGNIDADPLFTDAANGDFTLQSTSPAINSGDTTNISQYLPATDLAGNTRIVGGAVDMGAYESLTVPYTVLYVDSSAATSGNGGSWASPFKTLSEALSTALNNTNVDSILVAKGTYYPTGEQSGTNRDSVFLIARGGLKIYGGYPNGGGTRDTAANPVYLDGNIGSVDDSTDNSYHVMVIAGLPADADSVVVDGFTFRNGEANLSSSTKTYNGQDVSRDNGGGIELHNDALGNKMVIRNCTFTNNYGFSGGGLLTNTNTNPLISNCTFMDNMAAKGGGLYNYNGSSPAINNCTFEANKVASDGGGMFNDANCAPVVDSCIFENNVSNGSGGGMYNYNGSSPTITNCIFSKDTSGNQGGGIANFNAYLTISKCVFTENVTAYGGGISNNGASPTIDSCTFSKNTSSNSGGGIIGFNAASPTITNCIFTENSASSSGGGIENSSSSSPTLTNCLFSQNTATNYGGGMANLSSSLPTLTNCLFSQDSATYGGGMYNEDAGTSVKISNCIFTSNTVSANTAGICNNANATANITNCTISGNSGVSGGGNGVYTSGGSTIITNSIIYNNNGNIQGNATVTYSDVQDGYTGTGNIDADPQFTDAANDDFTLQSTSPAINTGSNDALPADDTLDLAGNTRIVDGTVDMGAYEYQGEATPVVLTGFSGTLQNGFANLQWHTGVENNFNYFEIQKSSVISTAGRNPNEGDSSTSLRSGQNDDGFTTVATLSAKGSNSNYSYTTPQTETTAYYRLKMVDNDGSATYSNIVTLSQSNNSNIVAYPNPATDHINIKVANAGSIRIYDASGRLVKTQTLQSGVNRIDVSMLSAGIYFADVNGVKVKFVKQ